MSTLTRELTGGDRRSIGKSNAVVGKILRSPSRFAEVIDGLTDGDPLIRMRCADAAEKASLQRPEWLQPHKRKLLELAKSSVEQELRWHLAQMLPRLKLDRRERRQTEAILLSYLKDKSRIVQTFALQALADLSADDSIRARPGPQAVARVEAPRRGLKHAPARQKLTLFFGQPVHQICRKRQVYCFGNDSSDCILPAVVWPNCLADFADSKHQPPDGGIEKPLPAQ
jgi:hypothetical protein